jgi:glyoxylase-like metal-dependent hydrolase (beta-lactamase superfamily II)
MINVYLIADGTEVTIVDAGVGGYFGDLPGESAAMGSSLDDVRALVLTHGHGDHIGFAERLRKERHVPVSVHEADAALARGEVPNPAKGFGPTRIGPPAALPVVWRATRGLRIIRWSEVGTFGDGATLDVPGSPRVVLVPGHTREVPRSTCRGADALFVR